MRFKKQFIKFAIILSSILLIISSLDNIIISEDSETVQNDVLNKNDEDNNLISPKSSGSWTLTSIYIDDTGGATHGTWAQCTANYDWCSYDGTYYVLENITLIGLFGTGIRIANSIQQFKIKNCTIRQKDTGIKFESVSNGEITNCYIEASGGWDSMGIYLDDSDDNNIYDNIIEFPSTEYYYYYYYFKGIRVDNCDYLDIDGNVIKGAYTGISIYDSINSFLTYNTISSCTYGIYSDYVQNTNISFNQIYGEALCGIYLYDNDDCTIEENFIADTRIGIGISETHNSLFKGNMLIDNNVAFGSLWYYWEPPGENNTFINNLIINSIKNKEYKEKKKDEIKFSMSEPSYFLLIFGILMISFVLTLIGVIKTSKGEGKKK